VYYTRFLSRDVIYAYIRCQCPSVCLSLCLSMTEVHWRIIANLCFKFWSQFTAHCGRGAYGPVMRERALNYWYSSVGAREGIIAGNPSRCLCASILAPKAFGARRTPKPENQSSRMKLALRARPWPPQTLLLDPPLWG